MLRQNVITEAEASTIVAAQLACSSLLAGGVGLIMFFWLNSLGFTRAFVIILALSCSMGAGLLATANIQYGVFLLHQALRRLVEGRPFTMPQSHWLWPLGALFRALTQANLRIDEIFQHERLTNEYHEQLLKQASEAAAAEERNHLARDLHDSIKQQIFSIRMSAIAARAQIQIGVTKAQEALEDILKSSDEAQVEMQALLQQLRSAPLEHTSLAEAVKTQAQALEYRSGALVTVEMTDLPDADRCPIHMQEVLFRIVQEAFANIGRHARAHHVYYTQTQDEKMLRVIIRDDGQGFDIQTVRKGMGLTNIQERVQSLDGTFKIESEAGKGTTLHVQIPLLLAPETREQQEQEEYTIQKTIEQAHGGLQLRSMIAAFTVVLLITNLGLVVLRTSLTMKELFVLILCFCILLMLYGLVSAQLAIVRLKHYQGKDDRRFQALSLQLHLGWASFFRLFFFVSWVIMFWGLYLLRARVQWWDLGLVVMAGSVLTLLLLESQLAKLAQDRYYPLLSHVLLGWEMRHRWRDIRLRGILCLCLGITLLGNNPLSFLIPITIWQWLLDYLLFSFLVIGVGIIVDIRRLQPWRKLAKNAL
jgi:signal transduction histidine kinase